MSTSSQTSTTPSSKRSPSPTPAQKKSFRSRVGTVVRRSSSFLVPSSKPTTPSVRASSEDPFNNADATPPKQSTSRPASIRSLASVPMVMPAQRRSEDQKPEPPAAVEAEPVALPAQAESAPAEPAPIETAPATREETHEPPASEPVSEPVAKPEEDAARANEQKPVEEPVYLPKKTESPTAIERHEELPHAEPEPEQELHHVHFGHAISDSPKAMSTELPQESVERTDSISGESTPEPTKGSPNHLRSLSVNTSRENLLVTELSPIIEDERSALEEKRMPFAHPNGVLPRSGLSAPPIVATTFSGSSDGTTPRAMPEPVPDVAVDYYSPHADEDKGKEKELRDLVTPAVHRQPQADYFSPIAPMPVPQAPNQHYYNEDPFRDPEPASVSTARSAGMPEPHGHGYDALEEQVVVGPLEPTAPAPASHAYPLPPLGEVTSGHAQSYPSEYTLGAQSSRAPSINHEVETDETLPLLSHSKNANSDAFGKPAAAPHHVHENNGWICYSLPDSSTYYSHPGMRITTDINMQDPRKLGAVTGYLERKLVNDMTLPTAGWEIWLHDEGLRREEFVPIRCWVDHGSRALGYWPPPTYGSGGPSHPTAEDKLDLEYRYWAFMETHPAHLPLPVNAYSDAMDALTWSYTERLLKSNRRAPPPFTQHESQELIGILRSTSESESSVQAAVQTKIVARILRRIVQWKQHFFRPEKPLPRGAESVRTQSAMPYRKTFLDFILAWLCLGIPYLYANRQMYRFDEEGGLMRSAGPILVVGATICIVAATILVASLTFLALPGLDHVARTAGFIAILGSFSSLGASLIAAFRNQVEVQRMAARGGEGLVVRMSTLTGGSILPSLPAVFLVWSILSLVTGVVLYAFRGTTAIDPSHWTKFASFTRWTTVGVLGFCGGVLIVSMFAIRR